MSHDQDDGPESSRLERQQGASPTVHKHDYDVGFRKPPKGNRFKKGQSGNPKGRPKPSQISDVTPIIDSVLAEPAQIRDGDRVRTVSKLEATLRAQIGRALKGDPRAIRVLFNLGEKAGLFSKAQQKGFLELLEPKGEDGEIIHVYHAEQARKAAIDRTDPKIANR